MRTPWQIADLPWSENSHSTVFFSENTHGDELLLPTRGYAKEPNGNSIKMRYVMGKKYASIKRRPKTEASPSSATIAHNQRFVLPTDLLPEEHRLPNYHLTKISNATKTFQNWDAENKNRYQKKNGRKLRSDAITLESMAIILSCDQVKKVDPDKIWESAIKFKEWFEERYQTKVRTLDWHRDEGYINEDGEVERNDHIHLEFDNVNAQGKMVRRLFSKGDLVGFQDKIAEIYKPLGFIRGEDTTKKVATDEPKRGIAQKDWKKIQKSVTQKVLNSQIKILKAQLADSHAKRETYAKLEQLNRDLKERIRVKDLTTEEMQEKIEQFAKKLWAKDTEIKVVEKQNQGLEAKIDEAIMLKNASEEGYNEERFQNECWIEENSTLKDEIETLKDQIETLPSSDTFEELKSLKSHSQQLKAENMTLKEEVISEKQKNITLEARIKELEAEIRTFLNRNKVNTKAVAIIGDKGSSSEVLVNDLRGKGINALSVSINELIAMREEGTEPIIVLLSVSKAERRENLAEEGFGRSEINEIMLVPEVSGILKELKIKTDLNISSTDKVAISSVQEKLKHAGISPNPSLAPSPTPRR